MLIRDDLIVAIDIGTTKVSLLVAENSEDGKLKLIAKAIYPSLGIRKGIVVDLEKTIYSVEACIDRAEKTGDIEIASAFISIGGSHIQSLNNKGIVAISGINKEVLQEDIERVIETAKTFALPPNRKIIHVLPRDYSVDEQDGIRDPLGMAGSRLGVEVHIITALSTSVQNLLKCVNSAGISEEAVVFQGLASAYSVLSKDEKELGSVLIDIGGGTTDIVIYIGGSVMYTKVLPMGGEHVTNDIAICLRTPIEEAEKLKKKKGYAIASEVDENEKVEVPTPGGEDVNIISRRELCTIIEARMEEIFMFIRDSIKESGCYDILAGGVVITGGGSLLSGTKKLAEQILGLPVRFGKPSEDMIDFKNEIDSPIYSTSVGLLKFGVERKYYDDTNNLTYNFFKDIFNKIKYLFSK